MDKSWVVLVHLPVAYLFAGLWAVASMHAADRLLDEG
jgi:hypothetical protein